MTTHRHSRALRPTVLALEGRELLTGLSALWIGQDLHDYVGQAFAPGGNGVQDMRFALSGLAANRTVAWADVSGLGGGDWQYRGASNTWAVGLERPAGSTDADIYVEPYQIETGRAFLISVTYDDGSKDSAWVQGGAADPNLRMPSATAKLGWIGQDGADLVAAGPSVGPDNVQDVHLTLTNLAPTIPVDSVTITSSAGLAWAFGTNPAGLNNAAMSRHAADPSLGDLYLSPLGDLSGQTLTATIQYANGKSDVASVVAGHTNPGLAEAPNAGPMPAIRAGLAAAWVGQDGQDLAGPGAARVTLTGLPSGRTVVAAAISDSSRGLWAYRSAAGANVYFDSWSQNLAIQARPDGGLDVSFAPDRDESGALLTVRLAFDDGTQGVAWVFAGSTDPGRRAAGISATSIVAHPGDDLNTLANQYGTVRLAAGTYDLARPLVLDHAVSILADPGVTVRFSQGASDPAWSAAIKVRAGHVTLDGFAVRFAKSIRWADGVNYGPAVIGTTDNTDSTSALVVDLAITRLDIESPPVPSGGSAVEAPRLIRLASGLNGLISGNTLKGGTTEFLGGPWTITNNSYIGTVPNTFSWSAFAGHNTHDIRLTGNSAQPVGVSGQTYRFLVLTGSGNNDLVADNLSVGLGQRDGDAVDVNAAENILTESYSLQFEGMPTAISADGRLLQIPTPQGGPARTGDMVAILSGPAAGTYRRIAQALGPQTYLMDSPLPQGSYAISIAAGFVGETFRGNTVDTRGSTGTGNLILVGNHYGTTVANNHLLGGGQSFFITAAPSEHPDSWGWSHAPFLGGIIEGNVFEDALKAGTIAVEHSSAIKSNAGRVYFSSTLKNNTVVWTASFLAARGANPPTGLTVGDAGSLDPGELVLTTGGNTSSVPVGTTSPTLRIVSATIDGRAVRDETRSLAPPLTLFGGPTAVSLVSDTGLSPYDRETTDGRITFAAVAGAVSYEYAISGFPYKPLAKAGPFAPEGLTQGSNTILLRSVDASGRRSDVASYQFFLDNSPPRTSIPFLRLSDDTGVSDLDRVTSVRTPGFNVTGDPTDTMVLYRDNVPLARIIGDGVLVDPDPRPDGVYGYRLHRYDAAGNESDSPTVAVTIDGTAPPPVTSLSVSSSGLATFNASAPDVQYQYRVGANGSFVSIGRTTSFRPPAGDLVGVRAIDAAGNIGPETWFKKSAGVTSPVVTPPTPVVTVPKGAAARRQKAILARKVAIARAKARRAAMAERIAARRK